MERREVQEVLQTVQVHKLLLRRTLGESALGAYVIRVKILPADVDTDSEKIVDSVKQSLGDSCQIRAKQVEPIAFGLYALILDIVAPEEEGVIDGVEKSISTAPLVGQYELVGVSRMSSKLPPR